MLTDNTDNLLDSRLFIISGYNSQWAGQDTQGVADGYPNPYIADIESQDTRYVNLPLYQVFHQAQGFIQLVFIFAPRLGEVRFAAAPAARYF